MTKLYELTEELLFLFPDDGNGEIPADTMQKLQGLQLAWEEKVEGLWRLIRNLQSEHVAYATEAQRLYDHAQVIERRVDYLKDYLKQNMEQLGISKLRTQLGSVSIQKNSRPSIALADTLPCPICNGTGKNPASPADIPCPVCRGAKVFTPKIPDAFKRIEISLDGNKAYDAWKTGKLPAELIATVGRHIRIR